MSSHVVFGLIGAGGISQSQHLPNLTRAKNVRLKTVCDLHSDLLAQAQQQYGIANVTQSHHELLADPEIQAVVIGTRADSHVPLAIDALRAGKHVYVEKPLAETVEECRELLPIQRQSGCLLAVGFNRRMAPAYQKLRQIFRAHGGARNIYYRIADNLFQWGALAGVDPGTRVLHEVCHVFDLLRYLVESEITSVYCVSSRPDDEMITLTFASGCVATIMSSGYMTQDMPKEHLEAVVDIGGAIVTDFVEIRTFGLPDFDAVYRFAGRSHPKFDGLHQYVIEKQGAAGLMDFRRIFWEKSKRLEELTLTGSNENERRQLERYLKKTPNPSYMVNKGWQDSIEHMADSILNNTPCELSTAEDGLVAALISDAAILSRENGKPVPVVIPSPASAAEVVAPNRPTVEILNTGVRARQPARVK